VQPKKRENWRGKQILRWQQLHTPPARRKRGIPQRNFFKRKYGMNTSATELSFDSNMMWLTLADDRRLGVPLAYFPRLLAATPQQRQQFEFSGNGTGIHWDELDEDVSVQGLLMGVGDRTRGNRIAA